MGWEALFPSPAAAAVMVAGLAAGAMARGYTGFAMSALIVASWSLVTEPARAVALALGLEVIASVLLAVQVWRHIPWRRVAWLIAGAAAGTPFGVMALAAAPERALRLAIALFVLAASLAILAGVRLARPAGRGGTVAAGAVSGLANGATAMGGLPLAVFMLAGREAPHEMRAAMIAYFFLLDLIAIAFLAQAGLAGRAMLVDAAWSLPILVAGVWFGSRRFLGASPESFRRTTLAVLIGLAGLGLVRAAV